MRENRTYGSEAGKTGKPVFPTPIKCGTSHLRGDFLSRSDAMTAGEAYPSSRARLRCPNADSPAAYGSHLSRGPVLCGMKSAFSRGSTM